MTLSSTPARGAVLESFIRNIGWNLIGQIAPLIAALVSIPLLVKAIGTDRFGILTIGWMLIGYFSLFDFGLGRALTQIVSAKLANKEERQVPVLIWTGLALMFGLGLAAGVLLWTLGGWIIYSVLNIPPALQQEAQQSLTMLAPAIPFVVLATGLRGVLEARQAFKLVNLVRTPVGVLTFAAPLLVLPFSISLVPIFCILLLLRLLTTLFFVLACQRAMPDFWRMGFSAKVVPELVRFGGWMTVSNIIGPVMVNMDRLVIGAVLSISAVTYYTTPFEMVLRLLVVPGAIAGVCFPMFAEHAAHPDQAKSRAIFWRSTRYVLLFMLLMLLIILPGAELILKLWLNQDFARQSASVLKILAVGVLFNGVAHIPFAFIQGIGESKITAKFHLLELIIYLPLLYFFIHFNGINGVAIAWAIRAGIDAAMLFAYAHRKLRASAPQSVAPQTALDAHN